MWVVTGWHAQRSQNKLEIIQTTQNYLLILLEDA